jgi:uncharacterized protein (DUF58 family)
MTLLSESFLRKLDVLSVVTRRPVHGQLRGAHRSRRTGAGMVFTDFRPYSVGDDIRNIDWGIYLRMDRLILKLFEEEADLPIYLFVDASLSMDYGEPRKLDYACKIAAALSYLALLNHDRVNLVAHAAARIRRHRCFAFSKASRRAGRPACSRRCAISSACRAPAVS